MPAGRPPDLTATKRRLARSLAARPGLVGVGLEVDEAGRHVLVVLLLAGEAAREGLPQEFEGVPVVVRSSSPARRR